MEDIRKYNVGASDYSKHEIQPWDLWEFLSDGWRCDIVKRILRHKETDPRILDLKKIRHILLKIQDLICKGYIFQSHENIPTDMLVRVMEAYNLEFDECSILSYIMEYDPNMALPIENSIRHIERLIENEEGQ